MRLLGLADCSSRDISAHITHVSQVMIRYNLLASIKRTLDYDTIGGIFGDMYMGVHDTITKAMKNLFSISFSFCLAIMFFIMFSSIYR